MLLFGVAAIVGGVAVFPSFSSDKISGINAKEC